MRKQIGILSILCVVAMACGDGGSEPQCGDGDLGADEECDDGNLVDGDGCSSDCTVEPYCGDGNVDAPDEECDDGGTVDGDGCSSDCTVEPYCGDGNVDAPDEECDDGGNADGDGCSADCMYEHDCGDGNHELGEECDDGNDIPYDGCESDCTLTPDSVTCAELDPLASGTCELTAGGAAQLLTGVVLLDQTILYGGQVLVDASGTITCVGCDCTADAAGATEIECPEGVISPALINAHDHITYAHNFPYTDTGERYEHRNDWRIGKNGHTAIPYLRNATNAEVRWGELRFILGGATSTLGSGEVSGFLRNLDRDEQEGLGQEPVHYETFPLGDLDGTQLEHSCAYPDIETYADIANDDSYVPHVAEGIGAFAENEFYCVSGAASDGEDLLEPQSAFIHGVGLTPLDYARMADQGTDLIWSPRTNITLYGDTAVVTVADRLGVRIALGTDWIPTGSMNMLRELRCADSFNTEYLDGYFDDRSLWKMATIWAAETAAMDDVIGRLAPGMVADIAIFDGSEHAGYRAIIDAGAADVALVMRGGTVLYGDAGLVDAHPATGNCDLMDVCGDGNKRLCADDDIGMTLAELTSAVGTQYPLFFCDTPDNEPTCVPMRPDSVEGSTVYTGTRTADDLDGDGIDNSVDDCPNVFNPIRPLDAGAQADYDLDGVGDACDACPLEADTTDCTPFNPLDSDGDGTPDGTDNCKFIPNPSQLDDDEDGKGDLCDPCPHIYNPLEQACPATIYEIKSGAVTGAVAVYDALVTGCADSEGFYLQVKPGDPDYAGAEYSGVFVYHPSVVCSGAGATLLVGDRVTLQPAVAQEFYGQIELLDATITVESSEGEAPPAPQVVSAAEAGGTVATPLEGVIVQVNDVIVTNLAPPPGTGDSTPTGEFVVNGVLRVDNLFYSISPFPVLNATYSSLTGILTFRHNNSKLEPRGSADVIEGPPILVGFAPAQTYVRKDALAAETIPTPLSVTLSRPAESDTFVAIGSDDSLSLVATNLGPGNGVTIPAGSASAVVLVDALQQSANVQLTASLDTVDLQANVRVVDATEQPQVVAIEPSAGAVPPGVSLPLTVVLDIPALDPAGAAVTLATAPGTYGSVPASVVVPQDEVSATFDFLGIAEGAETVTATLAPSEVTATVTVSFGGALVINEVDYDQDGDDIAEFVEIYNTTAGTVSLSDYALVLVNGAATVNAEYKRVDLAPAVELEPHQFLVIGASDMLDSVPTTAKTLPFAAGSNNIQNGAPDALGILRVSTGELVDALSYEGEVTNATVSGAGTLDFVEGEPTPVADSNSVEGSLIRYPDGNDTDDAATDWAFTSTITPGEPNVP